MPKLQNAWTAEELAANRRGELAPSQVARIRRRRRILVVVASAPTFAIVYGATWWFARGWAESARLAVGIGFAVVIIGTLVAIARVAERPFRGNPTRVVPLTGKLDAIDDTDGEGTKTTSYFIAGQRLKPVYAGLDAFRGQTVTVFKLPDDPTVIAVEVT